jgi:hypothetical protein
MKYRLGAAALLALLALLQLDAARKDGVTFDEVYHIPAGYVFLHGGPFFDRGHPPLALYLYALALPGGLTVDRDDKTWGRDETGYGARFLSLQAVPLRTLLLRARLVVIFLSLILALSVSEVARRRWGPSAGLLALALCATSPDLIAHGHLATSDLAAALAMFGAGVALHRFAERPDWPRTLVAALAVALAFLTKFTTMPLALIAAAYLVAQRGPTVKPLLRLGACTFLAVLVLGLASFGFQRGSLGEDLHLTQNDHPEAVRAAIARAAQLLHTTAPRLMSAQIPGYLFFKNVGFLIGRSLAPSLFSDAWIYLLGEYSKSGWHHYFIVTFLLKTPLPFLALLILAAIDKRPGARPLWIPPLVYYAVCLAIPTNVGHRHLLPIYPWLIAAVASLAASPQTWLRWAAWGLAAAGLVVVLEAHPYELSYFNRLAGPPEQSWARLSDSNIDWGQDVPRLAEWQRENHIGPIRADVMSSMPLAAQGVMVAAPNRKSRWQAVSVTRLLLREGPNPAKWGWLRCRKPEFRVGSSIFVYRDLP